MWDAEMQLIAEDLQRIALEQVDRLGRRQLERARRIQTRLLPMIDRQVGAYQIEATFEPAETVGGDFYDVIELPDRGALIAVLDVSGHGIAAALYTALLRTVLRYEAKSTLDPGAIATAMNREFLAVANVGDFATCCIVRLRPDGELEYASAGHDPPVIVGPGGSSVTLDHGGMAIGVLTGERYTSSPARLEPGCRLYLYTDGLHEASWADGTPLGRERLVRLLADASESPAALTARVRALVENGQFEDDVTLIRIQRR